ncbi:MAG: zf-HC2 domain-containing protein [Umezawaea sp.]
MPADNVLVDCDTCREALSARADGEPEPVPAEETDAHLATCAECRGWRESAAALTRALRLRPAVDVPDLTEAILAAAPPVAPSTRGWTARAALAGVAVAQLTLGLAQVFGVDTGHAGHAGGATHLFNESTAWNLALGLGMLWTALRPGATTGVLPVMAAFVAVLVPFSAQDLLSGAASMSRITSHALLVLGLVLLLVVHRGRAPGDGTPSTRVPRTTPTDLGAAAEVPEKSEPDRRRWGHLRPVSRKHAA